jgi:hypothetical protein
VESADASLPAVGAFIESVRAAVERHRELLDPTTPRELPGIDPRIIVAGAAGALAAEGIALRDIERGLVDFSAVSPSGRPYWLCWVVGEEKVMWWHWVEDGFAGRTPLSQPPV